MLRDTITQIRGRFDMQEDLRYKKSQFSFTKTAPRHQAVPQTHIPLCSLPCHIMCTMKDSYC